MLGTMTLHVNRSSVVVATKSWCVENMLFEGNLHFWFTLRSIPGECSCCNGTFSVLLVSARVLWSHVQ